MDNDQEKITIKRFLWQISLVVLLLGMVIPVDTTYAYACKPPPTDKPTVTLLPDGHTVEVEYIYVFSEPEPEQDSGEGLLPTPFNLVWAFISKIFGKQPVYAQAAPYLGLYRSTQLGFAPSDVKRAIQFGSHGISFDTNVDGGKIYYYQAEAKNNDQSVYSNASGVFTRELEDATCSVEHNTSLAGASVVSSTATTITLELTFYVQPRSYQGCGCDVSGCTVQNPPPYLKFTSQSTAKNAFVPWVNPTLSRCISIQRACGESHCFNTEYKARYIIDLPPGKSDTFTIRGYHADRCDTIANIGSTNVSVSTTTGPAPAPLTPAINTSADRDQEKKPFVRISWNQTQAGQEVHVYRSSERWSDAENIGGDVTTDRYSVHIISHDDLNGKPAGTYYYGAKIHSPDLPADCQTIYSDQNLFLWIPPTLLAPSVNTQAATNVGSTTATLNSRVNPWGLSTTGWFRYSTTSPGTCNDTFGTRAPSSGGSSLGSGTSSVSDSRSISALTAGTPYYFCAVAENAGGKTPGDIEQFTTTAPPPPPPETPLACGTGTARATGLVSTSSLFPGSNFGSTGACIVDPKAAFAPFKIPAYLDLKSLYFDQSKSLRKTALADSPNHGTLTSALLPEDLDRIFYIDGNLTLDQSPFSGRARNVPVVIFVKGNLNINSNISYASSDANAGLVLVAGGDVAIDPSVASVNAVIIAEGKIYTGANADSTCSTSSVSASALTINGSLVSLNPDNPVQFCRTLSDNSLPAEKINHQVKYLVILRHLLSDTYQKWGEVP